MLQRYVRYANTPSNTFPPTGVTWTTVADHLIDFDLQYLDDAGTVISTGTLSATQRGAVRRIVFLLEGFNAVGPQGGTQTILLESEVLVRNLDL